MSDQDYIYGVFADSSNVPAVISQLHKAGLRTSEICVLGNRSEQFTRIAGKIEDPTAKCFVHFGIAGAFAGLIAGIAISLHIPGVNGFQLIVPLMGTLAGGACFPYFTCQLATFLTSNKPQHWANVFEGSVADGDTIIMAEPQNSRQRQAAMDILFSANPNELILRRKPWGISQAAQPALAVDQLENEVKHELEQEFEQEHERRLTAVA